MPFNLSAKYKKNRIHIKFNQDVIPIGGEIKLRGTSPKSQILETIKMGSPKISGDVYSLESMLWDYSYNSIALNNYDIFSRLASHDKKKISDKTNEEWAFDLRMGWNVSIDGKLYRLDEDQYLSADEVYNFHATTPEYTPGTDKSGNANIVLSPLEGIRTLSIKPSKRILQSGNLGSIDISDLGLISPKGGLNEKLELPVESKKIQNMPNTKKPGTPKPLNRENTFGQVISRLQDIQYILDNLGGNLKGIDVITGKFDTGVEEHNRKYRSELRLSLHDLKAPKRALQFLALAEHTKGGKVIINQDYRAKSWHKSPREGDTAFGESMKSGKLTHKYFNGDGVRIVTLKYDSIESKQKLESRSFDARVALTLSEREMVFKDRHGEMLATATFAENII